VVLEIRGIDGAEDLISSDTALMVLVEDLVLSDLADLILTVTILGVVVSEIVFMTLGDIIIITDEVMETPTYITTEIT
jgi:hypothetical protein